MFVGDLAQIYINYARSNGLSCSLLCAEHGRFAVEIQGKNVYSYFRNEPGKHIIQRIPPTEHKGRVHTSVVTVTLSPVFNYVKSKLNMKDINIKFQRGSGPGGQHRNKTESAVKVTHIPTGEQVFIDTSRSQADNKQKALQILESRLDARIYQEQKTSHEQLKSLQRGNGDRAGKIRTYDFKDGIIIDHRLGKQTGLIKDFMKGRMDVLFLS